MVRIGIVGIGIIAEDYIGLISAGRVPHVQITALCSRNQERIQQVIKQYGLSVDHFQNYDDMISSGEIDAVMICTPHGLHPEMTRTALKAGLHVLLEKPVGIYADEVEECADLLHMNPNLVCGVIYNRRASKAYRYIKSVIESGKIGELIRCTWIITNLYRTDAYYGSSPWRGSWKSEGGGLLMTQASHQLDLMQWLCGMPSEVVARISTVNRPICVENEAELFMSYPNGAHGHFIASAHECPGTNLLEICGTQGKIIIQDDSKVQIICLNEDERHFAKTCQSFFEKVPETVETLFFDDSDNAIQQAATIENFALAVQGGTQIQCPLEDGLKSLQIIHGAYMSSWRGRPETLPVDEKQFRMLLNEQ